MTPFAFLPMGRRARSQNTVKANDLVRHQRNRVNYHLHLPHYPPVRLMWSAPASRIITIAYNGPAVERGSCCRAQQYRKTLKRIARKGDACA